MKYGKKLPSRSVPEWRAHNILYNDIRDLIVAETNEGTVSREGYMRIFSLLSDEYQNINLFVKSKYGEIEQRLRTCQRLVDAIYLLPAPNSGDTDAGSFAGSYTDSFANSSKVGAYGTYSGSEHTGNAHISELISERDAKVYQLQCEVAKVSRDIQHLSRFAGAQFTGFRKLIKKFRKLASQSVSQLSNFEAMLTGPDSFASIDFTTTFLELSLLYDMLRSGRYVPFKSLPAWDALDTPQSLENQLCQFDVRMVSAPTRTEYLWVHSEDIMQVKVVLLQHLGLVAGSDRPQVTRTTFFDDKDYDLAMTGREPGQLWQVELLPSKESADKNANVKRAKSQAVFCAPTGGMRYFCAAGVSRGVASKLKSGSLAAKDLDGLDHNAMFALGWALSRSIKAQATVTSSRLRYEEPTQAVDHGSVPEQQVWAVIDSNVTVQNCDNKLAQFPHHVLQIRYTGAERPKWVSEIVQSHLLFQVSESFSLYQYALYILQTHAVFRSAPSWASVLEQDVDIRQAPKPVRPQRSRRSIRPSTSSINTSAATSPGATKTILLNDTSFNDSARYWNEFDHPEDDDDDANVFSVFINDEDEELMRILRAEALSQPLVRFSKSVRRSVRQVKQLLGFESHSATDGGLSSPDSDETQSLLTNDRLNGAQYSPRLAPSSGPEDLETRSDLLAVRAGQRRENMMMAMLTTVCMTLAIIIDVMVYAILFSEDVDDLVVGAQIVLVVGLVLSAVLSGLGAMAFGLHSSNHWLPQVTVHALWFAVMCFGVGGIAWIVTT